MGYSSSGYFKSKLISWKKNLLEEKKNQMRLLQEGMGLEADEYDRASIELEYHYEFSKLEREEKLLREIERALERIEKGTYGYCQETDEMIPFERLNAWPIARFSIDIQEKIDKNLNNYRVI